MFFVGMYDIVLQWNFRYRDYKIITRTRISQSIASNFNTILFGFMEFGPIGLILGAIIGQSAGITSLASPIFKNGKLLSKINFKQLQIPPSQS